MAKKAEALKTLDRKLAAGRSYASYAELLDFGGRKLRVDIRSDAYQEQCFARVSIWSPAGYCWSCLAGLDPSDMMTQAGLADGPSEVKLDHFKADRDELLRLAQLVLADG